MTDLCRYSKSFVRIISYMTGALRCTALLSLGLCCYIRQLNISLFSIPETEMKYLLPNMIWLLLFSMILSLTSGGLYAQRSVAELISVMPPPKDRVEYKDGVRQINILNDHLFVTNFWAGLQVVDISDIKNPRQTAFLPSDDEVLYPYRRKIRLYGQSLHRSAGI